MTSHFLAFLKLIGCDERRKASNILHRPALQLKLPLYILILSATFGVAALLVGYIYFEQLYVMMLENTSQGNYLQDAIRQQTSNFLEASVALIFGYVLLTLVITVIYTHKIIGPTIAIRRHIKALKEGLYSHRVSLRKDDELKDLAGELNELAEVLEQSKTGGPGSN